MKNKTLSQFKSWEEVNEAMKILAEKKIALQKKEGEQTLEINTIKARFKEEVKHLLPEVENLEKEIEKFCEANKQEFLKERTKKLSFGNISYRIVKSVKIKNVKSYVAALKSLGMKDCLKVTETPNKERLQELDESTLLKIGAKLEKVDKLTIEPVIEDIVQV